MAWIKLEHVTPDKPEVFGIASILGIDPDAVVGKLVRLWIWFDQQTYDGTEQIALSIVDTIARCPGFGKALMGVGWLTDGGIPAFDRHNGRSAKSRAQAQRRMSRYRDDAVTPDRNDRVTIPRALRVQVFTRDGHRCVYCGRAEGQFTPPETSWHGRLTLDHVVPCSRGGDTSASNLVTCCLVCNTKKRDRTPEEAGLEWPEIASRKRNGIVTQPSRGRDQIREDNRYTPPDVLRTSSPPKSSNRFAPPTVEEVAAYCRERGSKVDPQAFVDFYASKGWMVGQNRMKDWKAAVRTWERRPVANGKPGPDDPEFYSGLASMGGDDEQG